MTLSSPIMHLVEFDCRGQRLALPLERVRRVLPSAAPAPLPGAPGLVLGVLNVAGEPVAVLDLGLRLGFAPAPIVPAQRIVVVELAGLLAGMLVDRVHGVSERAQAVQVPQELGAAPYVAGLVRLEDGLGVLVDPDAFLFPREVEDLARALLEAADGGA